MDVITMAKLVAFILAAPFATAIACKLMSATRKPSQAEVAQAQETAAAARQEAVTSAISREALRQEEREGTAA